MKNNEHFENTIGADALIQLRMDDNTLSIPSYISTEIANLERTAKEIEAKQKALKAKLLEEMEKHGIIKIDTEDLTITYVAPTTRETFDGKSFRADFPDLYDEYVKIGTVSPSVRLKLKGEKQ